MLWLQKQAVEASYRAATEQPAVAHEPPVSGLGEGREQKGRKQKWGGRGGGSRWQAGDSLLQSLGPITALPLTSL